MNTDYIGWRRLTPDTVADLPEDSAVFEIANLVRTIQYIGTARGNLRARLATFGSEGLRLPACPGGYYFRYETVAIEDEALSSRLDEYRAKYANLPAGNRNNRASALRLAARDAA